MRGRRGGAVASPGMAPVAGCAGAGLAWLAGRSRGPSLGRNRSGRSPGPAPPRPALAGLGWPDPAAMRSRLAGTRLTRAAVSRPAPAGSRVAAAALVVSGLVVSGLTVSGVAGPGRAGTGLAGRGWLGWSWLGWGWLGAGWLGWIKMGVGWPDKAWLGSGVARPQLAGPGPVCPMRAAGQGRVDPDQPRGRGDREQPGDQHHADDQRPAIGPSAAGQPGVFRRCLMAGSASIWTAWAVPASLERRRGSVLRASPGWASRARPGRSRADLPRVDPVRVQRSRPGPRDRTRTPPDPASARRPERGCGGAGMRRERATGASADRVAGPGFRSRVVSRGPATAARGTRLDQASLDWSWIDRAGRGHAGRLCPSGGTGRRAATRAEPQDPADRGSACGAESHRRQPSLNACRSRSPWRVAGWPGRAGRWLRRSRPAWPRVSRLPGPGRTRSGASAGWHSWLIASLIFRPMTISSRRSGDI